MATRQPVTNLIGRSVCGRAIETLRIAESSPRVLVMSGIHGDEVEGVSLGSMLARELLHRHLDIFGNFEFLIVANPDGMNLHQRWNFNGVDLNRNFATCDWTANYSNPRYPPGPAAASEPEVAAISALIEKSNYDLVVELHSYKKSVLMPYSCEPSDLLKTLTMQLSHETQLPILWEDQDLGYPITGGLHSYCKEKRIHNFTIEIEKGLGQFAIADRLLEPVLRFLVQYASQSGEERSARAQSHTTRYPTPGSVKICSG